jgi:sec-independent protein translocase protein TatC
MTTRRFRPIAHDDRLSLVEHLDELRTRLIICGAVLTAAFAFCFWQNNALLHIVNRPLERQTAKSVAKGNGPQGQAVITQQALLNLAAVEKQWTRVLATPGSGLHGPARAQVAALAPAIDLAVARVPRVPQGNQPYTFGIGEPFAQTVTISFYFALLIALPLILYELYAFVLPAFSPDERRVATPLMAAIPVLFIIGVVFGYFVVLPAAVRFLQNFNASQFNVVVQAAPYYHFAALMLLVMGLVFQVPVAILAAVRAGVVTPKQLRRSRRYAIVIAAVIAALLPGDAITMALEMLPLIVLYEVSILLATVMERRAAAGRNQVAAVVSAVGGDGHAAPVPPIAPPDS